MLFKELHHLCLPKRGHTRDEYEDAAASDAKVGRFALADGASDSSYAGPWARLLVEGFVLGSALPLASWISRQRKRWLSDLGKGPFPWYTETKIEQGAFATFLGVILTRKQNDVVWNATAVGDSCAFQVRKGKTIVKFPLQRPEDFDNAPALVCSRSGQSKLGNSLEHRTEDNLCQPGDKLWLMTDALALWFLQQDAESKKPWEELEKILGGPKQEDAFASWIEQRRKTLDLRNDDVTLMAISF